MASSGLWENVILTKAYLKKRHQFMSDSIGAKRGKISTPWGWGGYYVKM